ncbi:helix-turn-helix domain-containing protein [Candidatus Poriferisocius sp.]|uniref:helix-turn-helix domain-containing protein n=1 Tax=Candidatus Poriferisocius sp. TaxID=3101276 RepID=UPI003B5A85DE
MDNTAIEAFGSYLRSQRKLAQLTLRELSDLAQVSNPYLSQLERGMHQPSVRVIKSLAKALNLSAETLLAQAAGIDDVNGTGPSNGSDTASSIRADANLSDEQKAALLEVYRSMTSDSPTP